MVLAAVCVTVVRSFRSFVSLEVIVRISVIIFFRITTEASADAVPLQQGPLAW